MKIPSKIKSILKKIESNNFSAFLVGGCVRDLLRGVKPKDYDITTNATPEEIIKIFPDNFYENNFGTVTVNGSVEITPYRTESKYTDKRHPDKIEWAKTIEEDLSRRDFTINAMAMDNKLKVVDLFNGQKDLENKIIRAVGNPNDRFSEDALRMIRAVRLACVLNFKIEDKTSKAISNNSKLIKIVSSERIRDEFLKIIMSDNAHDGIEILRTSGLLQYIIPEIEEGYGIEQNKHHTYDCYKHSILALKYATEQKFNIHVRIASLLHDVGKPRSKRGSGNNATFYGHEVIGAKMTEKILSRLKFKLVDKERITKLVRYHLFYYNVDEVTESSVRRLVRKVGPEIMSDLLEVRMADRIGSGVPKAEPYKLRHLKYIIEKISKDPISVKMLKINGGDIMKMLDSKPGPKIGFILDILLGQVIDDPKNNTAPFLKKEAKKLGSLTEKELKTLSIKSQKKRDSLVMKEDNMTKKKYWVT